MKSRTSIADLGNNDHDITKSAMDGISNINQSIREIQQGDFVGASENILEAGENIRTTATRGVEKVGEFSKKIIGKFPPITLPNLSMPSITGIKNFTKHLGF